MKKSKSILIAGILFVVGSLATADSYFEISKNLDVFSSVYKEVNQYYVDDVEPSKLMRTAIDAMLKTLDPFTNYFSGAQIETARMQQGGKFGGLGIDIEIIGGYPVIVAVTEGQPANKAGMKTGDIIKMIDGIGTQKRTKEEVSKILVGQPNTKIALGIERKISATESNQIPFLVTLEEIQETSVPFSGMLTPEIGCIQLRIFNDGAGKDVRTAFDSLKRSNPSMKGIILDLRGNPGGLLSEAVNVSNVFLEKNMLIATTRGKVKEWNNSFATVNNPSDTGIPVIAIINSSSASASEIVAGTLQDYDRGLVLGQKSYGKGLVQNTRNLSYNTMLKVTTAKYYIPSGRCVQALNYAERNPDGSVKRVPDSLKVAFKTRNGRIVWDGGGIDPDVSLPKKALSKVAEHLLKEHLIFDFATSYVWQHPAIAEPGNFKLTDKDFDEFNSFVQERKLSYQTTTEEKLEELKSATTEEKYFDAVRNYYEAVSKKLQELKQRDMLLHREEITTLLENEIIGRYYYAYGKARKSYQNDPEVAKAISLLLNPKEYRELLSSPK